MNLNYIFYSPIGKEDEYSLLYMIGNGEAKADHVLLAESEKQRVGPMRDLSSERERRITEMSFGFKGEWPILPRVIASVLGISSEQYVTLAAKKAERKCIFLNRK